MLCNSRVSPLMHMPPGRMPWGMTGGMRHVAMGDDRRNRPRSLAVLFYGRHGFMYRTLSMSKTQSRDGSVCALMPCGALLVWTFFATWEPEALHTVKRAPGEHSSKALPGPPRGYRYTDIRGTQKHGATAGTRAASSLPDQTTVP